MRLPLVLMSAVILSTTCAAGNAKPASRKPIPAVSQHKPLIRTHATASGRTDGRSLARSFSISAAKRIGASGRFQPKAIAKLNARRSLREQVFGDAVPTGVKGEIPHAQHFDAAFNCADVVESSRDKNNPGCYPVSPAMRARLFSQQ